jgi:hypothetical protein
MPAARTPAAKRPVSRSRTIAAPYRPNYWLVAAMTLLVGFLAVAFLVTILILWSIVGALITCVMVLTYAAIMYPLWRLGISRL